MSFTSDVREELARLEPECPDCRRAQLSALTRTSGRLSQNYRLEISTETASVARNAVTLLHSVYGLRTESTIRRSVLHKTYNYLITVPPQPGLKEALEDLGIVSSQGLELGAPASLVRKDCCAAAYLRGAFLGSGFISDPRGSFHFEMSCGHQELAQALVGLMARRDIPARYIQRRSSFVVYLKGADPIVDFLALTGAHRCVLAMENARVTKSVRNDVNRRLNAEIANQAKTIQASMNQIAAIELLRERGLVEGLSPALQQFIQLREANPDVSLRELGELADPPLSKSAVNHRMRRIEELAAGLE